jgi:hypothetical protein
VALIGIARCFELDQILDFGLDLDRNPGGLSSAGVTIVPGGCE